jgi:hypothetical protein
VLLHREYVVVASSRVCGLRLLPVLEIWCGLTNRLCVGTVRPVGFVVLTDDAGYWLVDPHLLDDLVQAVLSCTS